MSKNSILFCLLIYLLPLASSQQDEFICIGFSGGGSINVSLNGVAEIENGGVLRLTNETSRLIGRAFYPQSFRFKNSAGAGAGEFSSFSTAFAFAIVPEYPKLGGHGFAFVLSPTRELAGALPSQYLGLLNSSDNGNDTNHLLAVEFDTVQDFEFQDINDNHVGVDIDSLISSKSAAAAYFDSDSGSQQPLNLKTGDTIQAWIDYDGATKLLNVTLSPSSAKPISPLFSFPVDLSRILDDEMFVGFSASTGLLSSSHYLFGWSFKMNGAAQSLDLSSLPTLSKLSKSKKKNGTSAAIVASLSTTVLILIAVFIAACFFYRIKNAELIEPWELEHSPHRFSYNELRRATKGFRDRELLGFGGFGKVYKGVLSSSGADIAETHLPRFETGDSRIRRRDRQQRPAPPPPPRPTPRMVPPPRRPPPRLRLHAQRQPRPLPLLQRVGGSAASHVGAAIPHPPRRGLRAAIPPRRVGARRHPPRREGEQCATRREPQRPARRLRAREAPGARGQPEHDEGGGDARVPRAGADEDGESHDKLRRVRLRSAGARSGLRAKAHRAQSDAGGAYTC